MYFPVYCHLLRKPVILIFHSFKRDSTDCFIFFSKRSTSVVISAFHDKSITIPKWDIALSLLKNYASWIELIRGNDSRIPSEFWPITSAIAYGGGRLCFWVGTASIWWEALIMWPLSSLFLSYRLGRRMCLVSREKSSAGIPSHLHASFQKCQQAVDYISALDLPQAHGMFRRPSPLCCCLPLLSLYEGIEKFRWKEEL